MAGRVDKFGRPRNVGGINDTITYYSSSSSFISGVNMQKMNNTFLRRDAADPASGELNMADY